jgi:hypothetical protein
VKLDARSKSSPAAVRDHSLRRPSRRIIWTILSVSLIGLSAAIGCANRGSAGPVDVTADAASSAAAGRAGAAIGGSAGGAIGGGGTNSDGGAAGSAADANGGVSGQGGASSPAGGASGASGGSGGAPSTGVGGAGGPVDGWYEAEAVPPNMLTNAATVSDTDEGQNRACVLDTRAGLSQVEAHGVTEGADCASAGGMVVNILGRSPCNPETPSSYSNCQNLGAGVEFHGVTVPADGTYDVTWWYHCGLDDHYGDTKCGGVKYSVGSSCRPHLIDVNGVPISSNAGAKYYQFPCYPTAWSLIHAATTALPLKAGSNTIYIHAPGATTLDAADIDAINVLPAGKGAPPLATPMATGD